MTPPRMRAINTDGIMHFGEHLKKTSLTLKVYEQCKRTWIFSVSFDDDHQPQQSNLANRLSPKQRLAAHRQGGVSVHTLRFPLFVLWV